MKRDQGGHQIKDLQDDKTGFCLKYLYHFHPTRRRLEPEPVPPP
jgi:hypothetical protein